MENGDTPSIWSKIDPSLVQAPAEPVQDANAIAKAEEARKTWRWVRPILDLLGTVFWLYALLKLFVVDIDSEIFGNLAQYRFFFFLAVAAFLVLSIRKTWPIVAAFAYIRGFPLVVVCWKLPKWLYKSGSPVAFLAAVNAVTSLLGDIKHSVIATTVAAFAGLAIATSHSRAILWVAGFAVVVLLLQALYRTIKFSVVPTRFLRMQQSAIRRSVDSGFVKNLLAPGEELRRAEIEKFNQTQQLTFIQHLGTAVLSHRALNFWAYQLEKYRRSPASLFFNALSYLWLLVRAVVALSFLNIAIYHADAGAYTYQHAPSFLVFVRYVIAGLYGSEIDALHPASELANAVSIATFVVGVIILGAVALSSVLSFRASRDESEIKDIISQIKSDGDRLDARVREEYEVSVPEAIERLEELKFGLMGLITAISTRIPQEFEQ
jgi:hypothetical protein